MNRHFLSFIILSVVLSSLFSSCNSTCQDCGENLLQPIYDNLSYTNNQTIKFSNNSTTRKNTVIIKYSEPDEKHGCFGLEKEHSTTCLGSLFITVGEISIEYFLNPWKEESLEGPNCSSPNGPFVFVDTVNYNYKGVRFKSLHYTIDQKYLEDFGQEYYDSINLKGEYYYDLYLTMNNRLIQYTIKKDGSYEKWIEEVNL